jgi:hypothetical protein
LQEVHGVLLLLLLVIIVLLPLDVLLDDARDKEVFIHVEVTVVGDEYLSQMIDFGRVVKAEVIGVAQPFCYEVPSLTFNEEELIGLPLEGFHSLQEANDVAKIFLEVLSEELIHDVKYASFSLIIELNVKVLTHYLPHFFFLLMRVILSGIDNFEEFDEGADVCGLLEELQQDVLDVPGRQAILHVSERVIIIHLCGLIFLYDPEHEALDHIIHPEQCLCLHLQLIILHSLKEGGRHCQPADSRLLPDGFQLCLP